MALALAATLAAPTVRAKPDHRLTVATLVPKRSQWGKVFRAWHKVVRKKTDGRVVIDVQYGGVHGGEATMLSKIRTGQIDGAALSSFALSKIQPDVLVLQLPGVFDKWSKLRRVRAKVGPDLEARFRAEGYELAGWGDIGRVRLMSKGFAVRTPNDLVRRRPVVMKADPVGPVVYRMIPGVVPVLLTPPEVLPALTTSNVNVVNAPVLAAEQLQWTPWLDHVSKNASGCATGATLLRTASLDRLPSDLRATVLKMASKIERRGNRRVHKMDEAAFRRLRRKMTVVDQTSAEAAVWDKAFERVAKRLSQGTLPKDLVARVRKIAQGS